MLDTLSSRSKRFEVFVHSTCYVDVKLSKQTNEQANAHAHTQKKKKKNFFMKSHTLKSRLPPDTHNRNGFYEDGVVGDVDDKAAIHTLIRLILYNNS